MAEPIDRSKRKKRENILEQQDGRSHFTIILLRVNDDDIFFIARLYVYNFLIH